MRIRWNNKCASAARCPLGSDVSMRYDPLRKVLRPTVLLVRRCTVADLLQELVARAFVPEQSSSHPLLIVLSVRQNSQAQRIFGDAPACALLLPDAAASGPHPRCMHRKQLLAHVRTPLTRCVTSGNSSSFPCGCLNASMTVSPTRSSPLSCQRSLLTWCPGFAQHLKPQRLIALPAVSLPDRRALSDYSASDRLRRIRTAWWTAARHTSGPKAPQVSLAIQGTLTRQSARSPLQYELSCICIDGVGLWRFVCRTRMAISRSHTDCIALVLLRRNHGLTAKYQPARSAQCSAACLSYACSVSNAAGRARGVRLCNVGRLSPALP